MDDSFINLGGPGAPSFCELGCGRMIVYADRMMDCVHDMCGIINESRESGGWVGLNWLRLKEKSTSSIF